MRDTTLNRFTRRKFLSGASVLGSAALVGIPYKAAEEPPPETTRIRLNSVPVICFAPQFPGEEMLRLEGFSKVEYIELLHTRGTTTLAAGEADLSMEGIESFIPALDAGEPIVGLAGVHA